MKVIVVRRFPDLQPQPDSTIVVNRFRHGRYAYAIRDNSEGDAVFDCLLCEELVRVLPLIHDMMSYIYIRFSIGQRATEIEDTLYERTLEQNFELRGVQLSALPRIYC